MLYCVGYAYLLKVKNCYWLELEPRDRVAVCMDLLCQHQTPVKQNEYSNFNFTAEDQNVL